MARPTVLSISSSPWHHPFWTSRQFLMYEMAAWADVHYTTGRRSLRSLFRAERWRETTPEPPFPPPDGLSLLSPFWPRVYRPELARSVLDGLHVGRLQKRLDGGGGRRIVYLWKPSFVELVRALDYDTLVYHPYDMFRHFVNAPEALVAQEEEVCDLADVVVTPHRRIADELGHPDTHVISNGVFLPAFPDRSTLEPPAALEGIEGPVVGFIGAINDKLDYDLLFRIFSQEPGWTLMVFGFEGPGAWKTSSGYRRLRELPNVRFPGSVPIDEVAAVMAGFDVGVIPYGQSGWAKFIESPLKLYQYWAVGVPVVCSPLPTLESRGWALQVCGSAEEWRAGIRTQLEERTEEGRRELRELAQDNDWSAKARRILEMLER